MDRVGDSFRNGGTAGSGAVVSGHRYSPLPLFALPSQNASVAQLKLDVNELLGHDGRFGTVVGEGK